MNNPVMVLPDALSAILALNKVIETGGVPKPILDMAHLRASQINGCSYCVDMHSRDLKKDGESDERIWAVGAWRESPLFDEAERAALALTEAATRLADRADPVPDDVWKEAERHYDEKALSALLLAIGAINLWNRINVATRQVAGAQAGSRAQSAHEASPAHA
jgi:AhpD family alkylhydroperoxidase